MTLVAIAAALNDACVAGAAGNVIPVDIAAAKAAAIVSPVRGTELVPMLEANGRVMAAAARAAIDLPPFDNSAMDGYAARFSDFEGPGPWELSVRARIAAGESFDCDVEPKDAIRIFTGAEVPKPFDCVVMQEHCRRDGSRLIVERRPRPGENVRCRGEDVRVGALIMDTGLPLTPQLLALAAAQGLATLEVRRKVRIGLASTGSELREPGAPLGPGQIYNSNRVMIRSMLSTLRWAEIVDYGIVPDSREEHIRVFGEAARRCDVLVTTGGVSAGEEDHVVAAFGERGGTLDVLKVAMRPGKPVKIGMLGGMLLAALPGNPNAALVTFRQIALPAIRKLAGLTEIGPAWTQATAAFSYEKRAGRTEFVPVRIVGRDEAGRPRMEMLGRGSSASLMAMALADGIALLPPDATWIEPGTPLQLEPFG